MSEDNKALGRRFFDEVINGRNLDAIDELLADDFVEHEEMPGMPTDKEGPREFFRMLHAAMPDMHAEIDEMVSEGDRLVIRSTATGTHEGDLMGMPGTGQRVQMLWADFVQIRDGKVVAHWAVADMSGLMAPAPAGAA
ncbi:MAG: hypothetical protein QOE65_1630 [Solirubrobacteraceae bacterium]|jgi:steroid delta-isomerase-like uncharacterized protein|nr:hypothetical protein [Solirubrobacteraceae bacterium]